MNDITELGALTEIKGGNGFPEVYQGVTEGRYPFIKVSDMNLPGNEKNIVYANNYVGEELVNRLRLTILPPNTVVFAKVGAAVYLNKRRLLTEETIIDNNMMGLVASDIDSDYLYQLMLMIDLGKYTLPGALPSINQQIISHIKVPLILKPKQQKIAKILTTIDQLIDKTQAIIDKQTAIKQGMMADLFTRGIDLSTGQLRPPVEQAPELYKETELGWVPREWGVKSIEDADVSLVDGDRGNNYPSSNDLLSEGYCVFLSATNVTKKGFSWGELQFITEKKHNELGSGALLKGDVVVTTRGTVGNIAFYADTLPYSAIRINSGMLILRNNNLFLNSAFLYNLYAEYLFNIEFKKAVSGSAQPQLPAKDLKRFKVFIPSLKEQKAVNQKAVLLVDRLKKEDLYLQKLLEIKKGLMQDLLTGKVAV